MAGRTGLQRLVVVRTEAEIQECAREIACSFGTVAKDFGLTADNAPTNPAFLNPAKLREYLKKSAILHGLVCDEGMIGCVAIEKSKREPNTFYIERLAVLPPHRHCDHGKAQMDFAIGMIRKAGGREASIGIMTQNKPLKHWYLGQRFVERECKRFERIPFEVCFMSKWIEE